MKCLICAGGRIKETIWGGYSFKCRRYGIVRCRDCGFMFLNPLPAGDVLRDIYDGEDYFNNYYAGAGGVRSYIEAIDERRAEAAAIIDTIKRFKVNGRLLDVGCAAGGFLITARERGYDVSGIEPSRKMACYARDELGLDVHCGTLDEAGFKDRSFDIVYAGDVLEHIPGLEIGMENIKRLLADTGVLVINQPLTYNKSLYNIFLRLNMLFKKNRFAENPPSHLWEFTADTLNRFLERMGFEFLYYDVSEAWAKPLAAYERPGIKNIIGRSVKNLSRVVSGMAMLKGFNLGDRALAVCRKGRMCAA